MRPTLTRINRMWGLALMLISLIGCNPQEASPRQPSVGSETHWMQSCGGAEGCPEGSICRCGVCTISCDANAACGGAGPLSVCAEAGSEVQQLACGGQAAFEPAGLCLAPCEADVDCDDLGADLRCMGARCLRPADPDPEVGGEARVSRVRRVSVAAPEQTQVDLLIVVDDSGSMCQEQDALGRAVQALTAELVAGPDPVDLRAAVVSTDMRSEAAQGRFRATPAPPMPAINCIDRDGNPFVPDTADCPAELPLIAQGSGPADAEALGLALKCMVNTGTLGDGFEQGLEAMRRSLSCAGPNAAHFGECCVEGVYDPLCEPEVEPDFLRPGAQLMVVILSDENDCSAPDGVIDRSDNTQCEWQRDQLTPVQTYAQALQQLKRSPDAQIQIFALVGSDVGLTGGPTRFDPVEAAACEAPDDNPNYVAECCEGDVCQGSVQPSCSSDAGIAFSGYRYTELAQIFGRGCWPGEGPGACEICGEEDGLADQLDRALQQVIQGDYCLPSAPACLVVGPDNARPCQTDEERGDEIHYAVQVSLACVPEDDACAPGADRRPLARNTWRVRLDEPGCASGAVVELIEAPPPGRRIIVEYLEAEG